MEPLGAAKRFVKLRSVPLSTKRGESKTPDRFARPNKAFRRTPEATAAPNKASRTFQNTIAAHNLRPCTITKRFVAIGGGS